MSSVDIQIINYKTKEYTKTCVESVMSDISQSGIDAKVFVGDNASGDVLDVCPGVHTYMFEENKGFGAGHNALSRYGTSPYILILNPDIVLYEPHTIARLISSLEKDASDVVGPALVNEERHIQKWDHGEHEGVSGWFVSRIGRSMWRERKEPARVSWVSGACFLIKRSVFEETGGFDGRFFLYKEEEDLCVRIREKGGSVLYNPTIRVMHHGSVVASKSVYMKNSQLLFIQKHCKGVWKPLAQIASRVF